MIKVDNAIIMAAGTASRFAPISYEKPKGLVTVRGEVLIERQIKQLKEAGINEIYIVVGYKKECFKYLEEKFGVKLIENREYLVRNNNSSIFAARDVIKNSFICSSDNYFLENPFELEVESSYYATIFENGKTEEWCVTENEQGIMTNVQIGDQDSWVMMGHVFWSEEFSKKYMSILIGEYCKLSTIPKLWETIYIEHIDELPMKARHYDSNYIFEFDSLEELREFDESYKTSSNSVIMQQIASELRCLEKDIWNISVIKDSTNEAIGFKFTVNKMDYSYIYSTKQVSRL